MNRRPMVGTRKPRPAGRSAPRRVAGGPTAPTPGMTRAGAPRPTAALTPAATALTLPIAAAIGPIPGMNDRTGAILPRKPVIFDQMLTQLVSTRPLRPLQPVYAIPPSHLGLRVRPRVNASPQPCHALSGHYRGDASAPLCPAGQDVGPSSLEFGSQFLRVRGSVCVSSNVTLKKRH